MIDWVLLLFSLFLLTQQHQHESPEDGRMAIDAGCILQQLASR
jgi:hypothetical protein